MASRDRGTINVRPVEIRTAKLLFCPGAPNVPGLPYNSVCFTSLASPVIKKRSNISKPKKKDGDIKTLRPQGTKS